MNNAYNLSPRKQLAQGQHPPGYANGGRVQVGTTPLRSGVRNSPLESIRRANGLPGMKTGGKVC